MNLLCRKLRLHAHGSAEIDEVIRPGAWPMGAGAWTEQTEPQTGHRCRGGERVGDCNGSNLSNDRTGMIGGPSRGAAGGATSKARGTQLLGSVVAHGQFTCGADTTTPRALKGHAMRQHGDVMTRPEFGSAPERLFGVRILVQQPFSGTNSAVRAERDRTVPGGTVERRHLARELQVTGVIFAALVRDLDTRCDNVNGSALAGLALDPRLVGG